MLFKASSAQFATTFSPRGVRFLTCSAMSFADNAFAVLPPAVPINGLVAWGVASTQPSSFPIIALRNWRLNAVSLDAVFLEEKSAVALREALFTAAFFLVVPMALLRYSLLHFSVRSRQFQSLRINLIHSRCNRAVLNKI